MSKRKPHPDNAMINEFEAEGPAPGQGGSSGGQLGRDVGSRAEQHTTVRDTGMERPTGEDHPAADERKGPKALGELNPPRKR